MRENRFIVWVILGAALLVVLNLPESLTFRIKALVRDSLAPLQDALSGFERKTGESVRFIRGIGGLTEENRKMADELAHLRQEVRNLKALEKENRELRVQLRFQEGSRGRMIPAEVIARDLTGWWETIRLDKGSFQGVDRDMAVISSDGLVGKTISAAARSSDVLLISDPGCKVSARVARTGAFGIVSGTGAGGGGQVICQMDFINKNTPVLAGDEVVTAGMTGVFPKGLRAGGHGASGDGRVRRRHVLSFRGRNPPQGNDKGV